MTATASDVEPLLMRDLAAWAALSIGVGGALWAAGHRSGRTALAAFGRQTAAWGAIDAAIAGIGYARRKPDDPDRSARLRRTLLVNAALDVGYIGAGTALLLARERTGRLPRYSPEASAGDGGAIIVQGAFLLVQDLRYGVRLPR